MDQLLSILIDSRKKLLNSIDLKAKCDLAAKARKACAIGCVSSFLFMVIILLGFRILPFELIPALVGIGFLLFLLFAMLASRFGRLCSYEVGPSKKLAIAHFRKLSPEAETYYCAIKSQGRPFTRLDFLEIRRMAWFSKSKK